MRLPAMLCSALLACLLVVTATARADEVTIDPAGQAATIVVVTETTKSTAKAAPAATSEEATVCDESTCDKGSCDKGSCDKGSCDKGSCDKGSCDKGSCDKGSCDKGSCDKDTAVAAKKAAEEEEVEVVYPTHKQTKLIDVNPEGLAKTKLRSFCLMSDGTILAACGGQSGEVRLFSPAGEYLSRWQLPVDPDAINVGADGYVYVAGAGKLLRLTSAGEVALQSDAPHVQDADLKRDELRKTIIEQQKQSVVRYQQMSDRYAERLADLQDKVAKLEEAEEEVPPTLALQVTNAKRMAEQWQGIIERLGGTELSDEEIEQRVDAALKSKMAVASIGETGGEVFLATREATGYGYCVWRMSSDFTDGQVITTGLSGCCGQMDVQCCDNGLYVAENSRHRVYHVSRTGKELGEWGEGAREGLLGFGSCCNPMNVAFGPDNTVYTAESGSGRIKRYTPDGELVELVGKVDVVPGCKKVSIAVDQSGGRVYMMDITRHHIVLMEPLADGEQAAYSETRKSESTPPKTEAPAPGGDTLQLTTGI